MLSALAAGRSFLGSDLAALGRVRWQAPAPSWPLDDVVVELENGSHCAASIRSFSMLPGGRAETEFVERAWRSLLDENEFDPGRDWLGMFTGPCAESVWRDLQSLTAQATATRPHEMAMRISSGSESTTRVRLYRSFACPAHLAAALPLGDDAAPAWLLSRLVPRRFDFESRPSECRTAMLDLSRRSLIDEQADRASGLSEALLRLVAHRRPRGGSADWAVLQDQLGQRFAFVARPDVAPDVRLLDADGARSMRDVRSTLGGSLELRDRSALTALLEATDSNQLVALVGPSGCGKTVLAKQWLSIKADGFWFSASRLASGLDGVRNQLHLTRRPDEILRLAPWGACVVIDGLDRVHDPDAFTAARELAALVTSRRDLRLVLTAQDDEWPRILRELTHTDDVTAFEVVAVDDLDDSDIDDVFTAIPELGDFTARNQLQDLLRRPKLLDLTVQRLASGSAEDLGHGDLDESEFAEWFWQHFVEGASEDRIGRSAAMARLGEHQARELRFETPETDFEPAELASVGALVSDRLLRRHGSAISFAHDLYGDWARYRALVTHADDLPGWLAERADSSVWHRALRLRAIERLRVDPSGARWNEERRALEAAGRTGTRDRYLEAPLFASRPQASLEALWPLLVGGGGNLLRRVLDTFLFVATFPDPRALAAVAHLGDEVTDQAAAAYRLPRFPLWMGLVPVLTAHRDEAIELAGAQVARVCTTWLTGTPFDWPLRAQLAEIAAALGRHTLLEISRGATYADGLDVACWRATLAAGHERPREIADLVLSAFADRVPDPEPEPPKSGDERTVVRHQLVHDPFSRKPEGVLGGHESALRTTILDNGALAALATADPVAARQVLEAAALKRDHEPDDWMEIDGRNGIFASHFWFTGWPGHGPFPRFFEIAPDEALSALLSLIERATTRDSAAAEDVLTAHSSARESPRTWTGRPDQLGWHRGHGREAATLVSALMAAEQWLYRLADSDDPLLGHYASRLLAEDSSLVSLGLLTSVARKRPALLKHELRPLVVIPELLLCERLIEPPVGIPSVLRSGANMAIAQRLAEWDAMPHRRVSLMDEAIRLALFEANMAADFAELLDDLRRRADRGDPDVADLAHVLDRANYTEQPDADGAELVLKAREDRVRVIEQEQRELADASWWMLFPSQCRRLLSQESPLAREELDAFWDDAQRHLATAPERHAMTTADEALQHCLCGLAAVMTLYAGTLPSEDERRDWSRETLLAPLADWQDAARLETSSSMPDLQWPGFCTDAIPVLWAEAPEDRGLRRGIVALACDSDIYIVARLHANVAKQRERLGRHAAQLRTFSIQRAAALDQAAEHRHRSRRWSFEVHEYVLQDAGPPPANVAESVAAFIVGDTPDSLPVGWATEALRESGGRRLHQGAPRLDMNYIRAAWSWLPGISEETSEEEREEWLRLFTEIAQICHSRMAANAGDRHERPDTSDSWALGRLGAVVADLSETSEADALAESLLSVGIGAQDWIDDFLQGFIAAGLSRPTPSPAFARRWDWILRHVDSAAEWRGTRSLQFTMALLGIDELSRLHWQPDHQPVWNVMRETWSRCATANVSDPWFAERLAIFLQHVVVPAWVTHDALCWFADATAIGYPGHRSENVLEELAAWLGVIHAREPQLLMSVPDNAGRCGRRLLGHLADEGVALARQLQDRLRSRQSPDT